MPSPERGPEIPTNNTRQDEVHACRLVTSLCFTILDCTVQVVWHQPSALQLQSTWYFLTYLIFFSRL